MATTSSLWKEDNSSTFLKQMFNIALNDSLPLVNLTMNGSDPDPDPGPLSKANSYGAILVKLTLLFILTIVVLLGSYRFVVGLFSGYMDEKKEDSSDFYIGIRGPV